MSGALSLLRLYAFIEGTGATSENFNATEEKSVGCSLHMLRIVVYFYFTFVRIVLGEISVCVVTSTVYIGA